MRRVGLLSGRHSDDAQIASRCQVRPHRVASWAAAFAVRADL